MIPKCWETYCTVKKPGSGEIRPTPDRKRCWPNMRPWRRILRRPTLSPQTADGRRPAQKPDEVQSARQGLTRLLSSSASLASPKSYIAGWIKTPIICLRPLRWWILCWQSDDYCRYHERSAPVRCRMALHWPIWQKKSDANRSNFQNSRCVTAVFAIFLLLMKFCVN